MSATGLAVARSRYSGCGAAMTSRSAWLRTSASGRRSGSVVTYGSVHSTAPALKARIRLSL